MDLTVICTDVIDLRIKNNASFEKGVMARVFACFFFFYQVFQLLFNFNLTTGFEIYTHLSPNRNMFFSQNLKYTV